MTGSLLHQDVIESMVARSSAHSNDVEVLILAVRRGERQIDDLRKLIARLPSWPNVEPENVPISSRLIRELRALAGLS